MSLTIIIIAITVVISYFSFQNPVLFHKLKHYPVAEHGQKEYYRFVSSGFVHGSWMHLLINMYVLYMFGEVVENNLKYMLGDFGHIAFILLYLSTIIIADLPTYFKHKNNPGFASIGASGAVSGIVFVFILLFPWAKLSIFPLFFIQFPAILGGIGYLIYSSWASKNSQDHIDHSAHFYGAVYGMLFVIFLNPSIFPDFIHKIVTGLGLG